MPVSSVLRFHAQDCGRYCKATRNPFRRLFTIYITLSFRPTSLNTPDARFASSHAGDGRYLLRDPAWGMSNFTIDDNTTINGTHIRHTYYNESYSDTIQGQ